MSKKKSPPANSVQPETLIRSAEAAHMAANMAEQVAGRLTSVVVLLRHLQDPSPDVQADEDGWTLATVCELVESCQADLRKFLLADGAR